MNQEKLSQLFHHFVTKNNLPKACITLQDAVSGEKIKLTQGDLTTTTPFVLASVTKLWVTTLILQLMDQNKLSYENIVTDFIEKEKIIQLHHFLGEDYTASLTIRDLLFQRTGLPNIFFEEPVALRSRIADEDFSYSFSEAVRWVKSIEAHFIPGSKEAYYADINFILLGIIVESIHHQSLDDCIDKYIMCKLGLAHSYLANSEFDIIPALYIGGDYLKRPKLIASGQGAGGGISNSEDLMVFVRAFFEGVLFNKNHFDLLQDYLPLQGDYAPVEYGGGHMKLSLGKYEDKDRLSFYGHSGISGAFAFYCPELNVYLTGTTDNAKKSELCIQLIYLLLFELEKEA